MHWIKVIDHVIFTASKSVEVVFCLLKVFLERRFVSWTISMLLNINAIHRSTLYFYPSLPCFHSDMVLYHDVKCKRPNNFVSRSQSLQCGFDASVPVCFHWKLCHLPEEFPNWDTWTLYLHLAKSRRQVSWNNSFLRHREQWQYACSLWPELWHTGRYEFCDWRSSISWIIFTKYPGWPLAPFMHHLVFHWRQVLVLFGPSSNIYWIQVPERLWDPSWGLYDPGTGFDWRRLWWSWSICGQTGRLCIVD